MGSNRRTVAAAAATILASLSLYPVFYGFAWFWAGVGASLTVALAGTLTRLRRLPAFVCLTGGLAGLLVYLNIAFESARSWLYVAPTPTSLRLLWDLAGQGFRESAKYAPPVPELPGMMLLAAAGIGLTALLTDLIAVRLESAALAGLPLLLLFTEPFTLSVARGGFGLAVAFCLGTGGYLALLSSEGKDRIREWERPNPGPDELPDTHALATTGRRVGIASVAVALCLPLFIPGLHATRLFTSGQPGIGGSGGTGTGVGFPDPNVQLSKELHESKPSTVFQYQSSDATPGYFQIYVLDNLTASGWQLFSQPESLVQADPDLPAPPGLTQMAYASPETTTVTLSRSVGQDDLSALPVPYPATSVSTGGVVRADRSTLMVFDNNVRLTGLTYTVNSLDQGTAPPQALNQVPPAPSSITSHYSEVPSTYQGLRAIANQVITAADAKTPFEKAIALQEWLAGRDFTYTLNAPSVTDAHGLFEFLTVTKRGYCQQFAFAMAVLARLAGIPSRVAYGFTPGTQELSGVWQVTTHDAHAWPELYFRGFGWLRFEPTPVGSTGQGTATAPTYTQQPAGLFQQTPGSSSASARNPAGGSSSAKASLGHRFALPPGAVGNPGEFAVPTTGLSGWQVFGLVMLGLLALALLAAAAPSCARVAVRRRRWRSGARAGDAGMAHAAWRELRDDLVDYRAGYSPSESPRALAARVGAVLRLTEPGAAALARVCMAEERARYAGRPDSGTGLREDSATIRRAIAAASPRSTRWLARAFPSSVLTPAMIRFIQAADFSGRLDFDWFGKTRIGTRAGGGGSPGARSADEAAARRVEELVPAGTSDD
jgi:transglutaminase-like putative cysteine protease